ncbi:MAG TPA: hypothetical protein VM409_01175 [Chloroflexia bacterium]|nr:hypothetical protein [Chloroflexia bacterium]
MRLLITFKGHAEYESRHFDVEASMYELLKCDFLRYLNEGATALRGAAYNYVDIDTGQARELILRYDDILYIEAVPQTDHLDKHPSRTTTGNLNTGPLRARITASGILEG